MTILSKTFPVPSLQPITTYVELFTSMFLQQIHDAEMQTLQQGH